jgi:aspartyl-tRNA(Asn)/glutamyl-tRNA(Gln) amidotransferase subunit B
MKENWQAVIGLEIHAQLSTRSKIFSPAKNHFGDAPNSNISAVCTGQPGALPVLNKEVVKKAVQFGLAIEGNICEVSTFDRKSYFYPDCPKNFQITQFFHPIIVGGKIFASVEGKEKEFFIDHVHLEEDAGSLKHLKDYGIIDFNRSGAPLIEIVTKPCMHSAKEAASFAKAIRSILLYIDVSDCNMDQGSIRFDANVSVRKIHETTLRPKIEIKNLNSFNFLQLAINNEIERQITLYEKNPETKPEILLPQGTYRWDGNKKQVVLMRLKEEAQDYRYCPEPDLPPLILEKEEIDNIKHTIPELPRQRVQRYNTSFSLPVETAHQMVEDKEISDYYEKAVVFCSNKKMLARKA